MNEDLQQDSLQLPYRIRALFVQKEYDISESIGIVYSLITYMLLTWRLFLLACSHVCQYLRRKSGLYVCMYTYIFGKHALHFKAEKLPSKGKCRVCPTILQCQHV